MCVRAFFFVCAMRSDLINSLEEEQKKEEEEEEEEEGEGEKEGEYTDIEEEGGGNQKLTKKRNTSYKGFCGRFNSFLPRRPTISIPWLYDQIVLFLLSVFDMDTTEHCHEKILIVPSRRIRGWFMIFGLFLCFLGFFIFFMPEQMLKSFGWNAVEPIVSRLLGFLIISNGWLTMSVSNPAARSFHASITTNSVMLCMGIAIALIVVMVDSSEESTVKPMICITFMIGMGFLWMYCKGLTTTLNEHKHDDDEF